MGDGLEFRSVYQVCVSGLRIRSVYCIRSVYQVCVSGLVCKAVSGLCRFLCACCVRGHTPHCLRPSAFLASLLTQPESFEDRRPTCNPHAPSTDLGLKTSLLRLRQLAVRGRPVTRKYHLGGTLGTLGGEEGGTFREKLPFLGSTQIWNNC